MESRNVEVSLKPMQPPFIVAKTIGIAFIYFCVGTSSVLLGTTLVSITALFGTDTSIVAIALSANSGGYLAGAVLCAVVRDRLACSEELQYALAATLMTATVGAASWMPNIYAFIGVLAVEGLAVGYLDTGSPPYLLGLWCHRPKRSSILHAVYFVSSVAATVMPLLIGFILVGSSNTDGSHANTTVINTVGIDVGQFDTMPDVRWVFMLVSTIFFLATFYLFIMYSVSKKANGPVCCKKVVTRRNGYVQNCPAQPTSRSYRGVLLMLLFLFNFLHYSCKSVTRGFLAMFVITKYSWSIPMATNAITLFTGTSAIGRLISIFLSPVITSHVLLVINVLLVATGYILLAFVECLGDFIVWIAIPIASLGLSSIYATGLLWLSHYIEISSLSSGTAQIGATSAGIVMVLVVGFLIQSDAMLMTVVLAVCAGANVLVYIVMQLWASFATRVCYGNQQKENAINFNIHKTVINVMYESDEI